MYKNVYLFRGEQISKSAVAQQATFLNIEKTHIAKFPHLC